MDLSLNGKIAVVTGGSSGIGKATASLFLEEGCSVAVCGTNTEKLERVHREWLDAGFSEDRLLTLPCDVSSPEGPDRFADAVAGRFGGIDIWVNNAGGGIRGPFQDITEDIWKTVVNLNMLSVWRGAKAAARHMRQKGGAIVNISSYQVIMPTSYNITYASTKGAVCTMGKLLAGELGKYGIRVNTVLPGMIETDMVRERIEKNRAAFSDTTALGRVGQPLDVANVVVFLSSQRAGFMTGSEVVVSGGKFILQNQAKFNAV